MDNIERLELLASVAELYYVQTLTQANIANRLKFSRSKVSRLLTEARENGIVEVSIHHPLQRAIELEKRITERYHLKRALISKSGNQTLNQMLRSLGRLGANYLNEKLVDGSILGIGWGTAVYEVAQSLRPRILNDFRVVQIIGSIGFGDPTIDGPEVARSFAVNFSGSYHILNSPVIVQDRVTRDSLLNERNIQAVISMANKADYILAGIANSKPERSGLVRAGYLLEEELNTINERSGAVGDICAVLFNQDGEYNGIDFNKRVVGISLDQIKSTPAEVIGVAGGEEKADAILGALRGKLINTLITDDKAAEIVLSNDSK
jgi:DNA-binding transcriptional regulator LsrR (DeoR family)